ncbi:MAG: hypothetical protein ABSG45_09295, partial [Nitrososphaerales archaeon]
MSCLTLVLAAPIGPVRAHPVGDARATPYAAGPPGQPLTAEAVPTAYMHQAIQADGTNQALPTANYDEQLGEVFLQSLKGISYNVTATAQTDSNGYGPAYLLNGLTPAGYWYQVGLAYNWPYTSAQGGGYEPGFQMAYETFDPSGNSIFPTDGGGGNESFSGVVHANDVVLLSLTFSNKNVVMSAHDWSTGASASESYTAKGSTSFAGGL